MSDFIKIIASTPLDVVAILDSISDPSTGAISLFVGTTRDEFEGKKVIRLDYEAYIPMAEKKIKQLCDNIRSKWPGKIHHIAIHHRLGRVEPTEASVIIAITSAHRKESLDAVQYAIDTLKATVPIWKKEIYGNDDSVPKWKENKECVWSNSTKEKLSSSSNPETEDNLGKSEPSEKMSCDIDPNYVQITASNAEIERRINAFIDRKREEINSNNILEFCSRHGTNDNSAEFSCARTDSTGITRKKNSASHLRKSSVDNSNPGTCANGQEIVKSEYSGTIPFGMEERVDNLEQHLSLKPIQRELYLRLKDIEDRVLYLEGISPEYFDSVSKTIDETAKNGNTINSGQENRNNIRPSFGQAAQSKQSQVENTAYKEALTSSLCMINKRIQELQSKLKESKVENQEENI